MPKIWEHEVLMIERLHTRNRFSVSFSMSPSSWDRSLYAHRNVWQGVNHVTYSWVQLRQASLKLLILEHSSPQLWAPLTEVWRVIYVTCLLFSRTHQPHWPSYCPRAFAPARPSVCHPCLLPCLQGFEDAWHGGSFMKYKSENIQARVHTQLHQLFSRNSK